MNTVQLINILSEIDDKYILEYSNIILKTPSQKFQLIKALRPLIACLAVIILASSLLFSIFRYEESSKDFTNYYFESYEEFENILPKTALLKKLTNISTCEFEYLGTCKGHATDKNSFTNTENFESFTVLMYQDAKLLSTIQLTPNSEKNARELSSLHALSSEQTINQTIVYYAYNSDEHYYEAVFSIDNNLYTIEFMSSNETSLLNLIYLLLK